jgi:dihydroxyacetone kinase phosphotransfer subunit
LLLLEHLQIFIARIGEEGIALVGIVIVSHSKKLAEGIKELTQQMADRQLRIIAAGGMEEGTLGTDSIKISKAILEADTGDGVVVLVDLGSGILSAETAIELLDEEYFNTVKIADAPIVEGAVIAVIQASLGGTLAEVIHAAEEARGMQKL